MRRLLAVAVPALLLAALPAAATTITYSVHMTGAQEVGGGDLDGTASGTLTIDDASGAISWSFSFANIDPPTAMHIHGPDGPAGTNAGIFVSLGLDTSGGADTLISSTSTTPESALAINTTPSDFYVNIHNASFMGGAIRGQLGTVLPEPGRVALLVAGTLVLALARRRAPRRPAATRLLGWGA